MSINHLYHSWYKQIEQLRPGERVTRLRNLAWLLVGICRSKSVHLSQVALKIPGDANTLSITRRLSRFLDNPAIRVREWYEPVARNLLQAMADTVGEIRLIADGTKVGFGHQLLMVAVAFRRRAIPIAWTWVRKSRGHSSAAKQVALLAYVRRLIPVKTPVLLVGDSEFGAVDVICQVEAWKWSYVLRQKANHQVKLRESDWQPFGDLIEKPGQSNWLGRGLLTSRRTSAAARWRERWMSRYPEGRKRSWNPGDR